MTVRHRHRVAEPSRKVADSLAQFAGEHAVRHRVTVFLRRERERPPARQRVPLADPDGGPDPVQDLRALVTSSYRSRLVHRGVAASNASSRSVAQAQ